MNSWILIQPGVVKPLPFLHFTFAVRGSGEAGSKEGKGRKKECTGCRPAHGAVRRAVSRVPTLRVQRSEVKVLPHEGTSLSTGLAKQLPVCWDRPAEQLTDLSHGSH